MSQEQIRQMMEQNANAAAPSPEAVGALIGFIIFMAIIGILIVLAIQAVICLFLSKPLKAVPPQFQQISPGMVWLLMIPFFSIVWNFFVFPKVARSLKQFANAQGNHTVDDCGETIGWVYCGLVVGCIIPYLNILLGLAALVLLIIYLVKVNTVAGQLAYSQQPTMATPMSQPPQQPGGDAF